MGVGERSVAFDNDQLQAARQEHEQQPVLRGVIQGNGNTSSFYGREPH